MNIIFITGAPGTGKTAAAEKLHEKLGCPWFEFGWIPEFRQKNPHTALTYEEEEAMSVENLLLVADNYLRHGFDHVILTDIREEYTKTVYDHFPAGTVCLVTLYAENETIRYRVLNRDNGNEYRNADEAAILNEAIRNRTHLPDEIRISSETKSPGEIADEIIAYLQK